MKGLVTPLLVDFMSMLKTHSLLVWPIGPFFFASLQHPLLLEIFIFFFLVYLIVSMKVMLSTQWSGVDLIAAYLTHVIGELVACMIGHDKNSNSWEILFIRPIS